MSSTEFWEDIAPVGGLKAHSVRGASITAIVQLVRFLLMFGSQVVLARLLLPGDFGLVAMVTPVIGFVQVIADLGLTQAIVSRPRLRIAELNAFFWLNAGLALGLALLAGLSGPLLALLYHEPRVIGVTAACAVMIIVTAAGMLQFALLNRQMRFGTLGVIEVVSLAVNVLLSTTSAWFGCGYWSLVLGQAGGSLAGAVLAWSICRWRPRAPSFDRNAISMAKFGGNITISNLANYLNLTLDNVMIGAVLGRVILGLYDRGWKLAVQPLFQLLAPFSRVALPALSRIADDPDRYRRAFLSMAQTMMLATMPVMIFAGVLAEPLIHFLLGERWLRTAPIFAWLCVGATVTPVNVIVSWLLISQGRARAQMMLGTTAAAINVAAYAAGLPLGIVGVAACSAISVYVLQTPLLIGGAVQKGPINGRAMLQLLIPNAVAAAATAVLLWQIKIRLVIPEFWLLAVTATASLTIFLAVLACFPSSRAHVAELFRLAASFLRQRRAAANKTAVS